MSEDVFNGVGVEIKLNIDEDFLKIKETLTRMGVASTRDNTLYQSCHILHKRGRYAILHFKELFQLDGKPTNIDENDYARRNTITKLLQEWGLLKIVDETVIESLTAPLNQVKIISHGDKKNWELVSKYTVGNKRSY